MMSRLQQEIAEQPAVLSRLLEEGRGIADRIAAAIREFDPIFVMIAARGTSDNAGRYAQYLFGVYAGLPVALATPSVHTIYGATPKLSRALVIGISQSGQSHDVRRVITDARSQGALTVSITNNAESPLAAEAEYHFPMMAGEERAVAATKSYTAELGAIAMLAAALTQNSDLVDGLAKLPSWAAETLQQCEPISGWAERYRYMEKFAVLGRGYNYSTAFEISLKIKELCYITGVEYSEADFRHGPIAMIQPGFPVIMIMPKGEMLPLQRDLLKRLSELRAECLLITNADLGTEQAQKIMPFPAEIPEWLSPVVAVIPGQFLAMNLAAAMGNSLDAPIGLSKVTVTV